MNKKLIEIFSENISARFYNFPNTFNKTVIESLLEDKDEERKIYFQKLFNITFLDCLKYFREEASNEELNGFMRISIIKELLIKQHGKDYFDLLENYLNNYEEIINNKKARNRRK